MGVIGYIAAAIYLVLCFLAILNLKGILWALGATFTGVIAFFPIWGLIFWGYSNNIIWIAFLVCIIDSVIEGNRRSKF